MVVKCHHILYAGEYTGLQTATAAGVLTGCQERAPDVAECRTEGASSGEIRTTALEAKLGFISGGSRPVVGWDLKPVAPGTDVMSFKCAEAAFSASGSVIGQFAKVDRMASRVKLRYLATGGDQAVQQLEGGAKHTLTLAPSIGPSEPQGLAATIAIANESPLEIKPAP
jgi:hypothetical protein